MNSKATNTILTILARPAKRIEQTRMRHERGWSPKTTGAYCVGRGAGQPLKRSPHIEGKTNLPSSAPLLCLALPCTVFSTQRCDALKHKRTRTLCRRHRYSPQNRQQSYQQRSGHNIGRNQDRKGLRLSEAMTRRSVSGKNTQALARTWGA